MLIEHTSHGQRATSAVLMLISVHDFDIQLFSSPFHTTKLPQPPQAVTVVPAQCHSTPDHPQTDQADAVQRVARRAYGR